MSDNENLYLTFVELYNEDELNSNKKLILDDFIDNIRNRKSIKIKIKHERFVNGIFISYKSAKNCIVLKDFSGLFYRKYNLNDEFYQDYLPLLSCLK